MQHQRFAVIGIGQFGSAIARTLSTRGAEVLAVDASIDKVEAIKDEVAHAVALDATDKKALMSQNIQDMDAVVVAIGENFEGLLLCTFLLMELKVKRIITRAMGKAQRNILKQMGVNEILSPEDEVGASVAEKLLNPNVVAHLRLPDGYEIVEVKPPKEITNRTLGDIDLRKKYQLNLVTILRGEEVSRNDTIETEHHISGVPDANTIIHEEDLLVVFGSSKNIERFLEINK